MNEYALRFERDLRTIRDRLVQEKGEHSDECYALYLLNAALDAVETANAGESANELELPSSIPRRNWCRECDKGCGK